MSLSCGIGCMATKLSRGVRHILRRNPRYKIGDIVSLRSGGQPMTVTYSGPVVFAPGNWVICQWFADDGALSQEMFHEDAVILSGHSVS